MLLRKVLKPGWLAGVTLALALGYWIFDSLIVIGLWDNVEPILPAACEPISGLRGAEDIVVTRAGDLIISLDDRNPSSGNGRLMLIPVGSNTPQLLWDGGQLPFHPHGIDYRFDDGELLYVVNHGLAQDSVLQFRLHERKLQLLQQMDFHGGGLNDVVALSGGRFYVSVDHIPRSHLINQLGDYLRVPLGAVEYFDGNGFRRAIGGVRYANGLAITADGKTLFVAAMLSGSVDLYDVLNDGTLSARNSVRVPGAPDNLTVIDESEILVAVHPRVISLAHEQRDRRFKAPSRLLRVRLKKADAPEITEIFADRGDTISSVSVGALRNDALWLGSVFDNHMLTCKPVSAVMQ